MLGPDGDIAKEAGRLVVVEVARTDDRLTPTALLIDETPTEYVSLQWIEYAGGGQVDLDVDFGDGRIEHYEDVIVRDAVERR